MGPALFTVLEVTGGECSTLFSCFVVGPKVDLVHNMYMFTDIPVVPHKAVAEVSKIGNL